MYKRWVIHLTGESCIIFRNWLALEQAVSPGSIMPQKSKHQKHRINTNTWSFICPTHNANIHTLSYIQFLKTLESKYYHHHHVYFIDGNLRFQDQRNLVWITQLISGGMGTSPPPPYHSQATGLMLLTTTLQNLFREFRKYHWWL